MTIVGNGSVRLAGRDEIRGTGAGAHRRRGTALLAVVPIAILMIALMAAFATSGVDKSRAHVTALDSFRARAAAQSVASLTISDLWSEFDSAAGTSAQMWAFRAHLDTLGMADQSDATPPVRTDYQPRLSLAADIDGDATMDGIEIERVEVYRLDEWDSTSLVVEVDAVSRVGADGSSREQRSSIQETFSIHPPEWDGLDYALLANNVNCLLCHTTIDSAERFYNRDSALTGTFDLIRVGSIDAIHFREDPDSQIAGVTLIGGDAIMGDGESITDWSVFNLTAATHGNGKLLEDAFGNLTFEDLGVFDVANPDFDSDLYLDFYAYGARTPYELPESFPSPFADNGGVDPDTGTPRPDLAGNRTVDDSEFYAAVNGVDGQISGGAISLVPTGDRIASPSDLAALTAGNAASVSGVTDGNVYLHGTVDNPIYLDGNVAIDGDVIISGYVKGSGTIRARGNVFVTSDLVYDDAGGPNDPFRTYGTAADGTPNNLAIASGGNIVVGDFYRPAWGSGTPTDGSRSTSFNFTMEELAIFNRQEWMKTEPTLPGEPEYVMTGTETVWYDERYREYYEEEVPRWVWVETGNFIEEPIYEWVEQSNGLPEPYTETWWERVVVGYRQVPERERVQEGTRIVTRWRWVYTGERLSEEREVWEWQTPQHPNPYYDPYHLPRYYAFSEGDDVPIFNKDGHFDPVSGHWKSEERAGDWDSSKLTYADPGNSNDPLLYNPDGTPKAVISTVAPTADWIDAELMRGLIQSELGDQASGSATLEVDATLYSANSILGTVPDRNSPATDGTLLVNGGIVAADVGILAPNGTQVNFDERGATALAITADVGLEISRRVSAPKPTN
ncbi:MAG: hypothetical protein AAF957_15470 [Planctomycetota bacterium]